ncbi:MAG: ABC transporter substrate-binding protein [Desulfobacteraceae bacterium]|nr:ABC transporter substrate-binding protein [Desulfobacteraceae bacterium]MBC2755418.1 ABC transporter substrate-binding protein [Desulfobacteraceae bacterium]
MKKYIVTISILILFFYSLVSAEGITGQATERKSIRIRDAGGRFVEVRLPVKRLVVLTSDALEIIRALGAEDLVAGVYSDIAEDPLFWPKLKDKPKVGSWKGLNYELVVELNPDAVLCYAQRPGRDMEKKLKPFGIQVIRLDFFKLDNLEKEVEALGRILQKEKEARELIAWYRNNLNQMREMLRNVTSRPDVYIEGDSNYHTTGPGSGGHCMCALAGGHNIASNLSIPYPEVTPEWILMRDPNVIVKVTTRSTCDTCYAMTGVGALKNIRNRIMARPAWDHIGAVKEGKIYVIANEIWTGPRAIIGTSYLAKWFYPDFLKAFDPEALHKEYLENFQGIKYQGVYVYPN